MRTEDTFILIRKMSKFYLFPAIMLVPAMIPLVNAVVYSGHGGIGWLILPFSLPYILVRLSILIIKTKEKRKTVIGFSGVSLFLYFLISYPLATLAQHRIHAYSRLLMEDNFFYNMLIIPFSIIYRILSP